MVGSLPLSRRQLWAQRRSAWGRHRLLPSLSLRTPVPLALRSSALGVGGLPSLPFQFSCVSASLWHYIWCVYAFDIRVVFSVCSNLESLLTL